jgi:hypothetical protein
VGTATGYKLDGPGSIPGRDKIFFSSTASRPTLGSIQWVPGVKRLGREPENSPTTSAEKRKGGVTPPLLHVFMA